VVYKEHHLRRLAPLIDFTREYCGNGERPHLAGTSRSVSTETRPSSQLRPNGRSCLLDQSRVDPMQSPALLGTGRPALTARRTRSLANFCQND
jgi:hypothetical protein